MTLIVSGWVAIDTIETPFDKRTNMLGGSATCAALAASVFTDVRLLASVGEDFPDELRKGLDHPKLDLAGLVTEKGGQTSRWAGRYHYDMNARDTLDTQLGVNADWNPTLPAGWESSDTIFCAAGNPAVQKRLMQSLPKLQASMVDTIEFYMENDPQGVRDAFSTAHFVSINESEAREIAQMPSIARASTALLKGGPQRGVVVKLGEYGAAFRSPDDYFLAPGYPLDEVIDPTGAGDAFAGGFMGFLDEAGEVTDATIRRAVIYGSTLASFQVEDFGPGRLQRLTRQEVEDRYREFRRLTHFEVDD